MGRRVPRARPHAALYAATAVALTLSYSAEALAANINQINLVTDNAAFLASQGFTPAATEDPLLINPWGMSFGATTPFWISNQGSGTATLYTGTGAKQSLTVTIPSPSGPPSGPTGQVFGGGNFNLVGGGTAAFIFANLDGSISAWTGALGTTAAVQADTPNAVYTGLATGSSGGNNFLYAANHAGGIDVFDHNFAPTTLAGNFTDPNGLPPGLTPFNVMNIGGKLFVTYAQAGPDADEAPLGSGAIDIFNTDGTFISRFVTGSLSNNVSSPWGITVAPTGFAGLEGKFLVGNFSDDDGFINIFESNGDYVGKLLLGSDPFNVPYLWALGTRTGGAGVSTTSVYFTAGIGDEEHGLFAQLLAVPEPSTWAMMLLGFATIGFAFRRQQAKALVQVA